MLTATPTPPLSPDSTGPADGATFEQAEAVCAAYYDSMIGPERENWPHHQGWAGKGEPFKSKVRDRMRLALAALTPSAPITAPVREHLDRDQVISDCVERARRFWEVVNAAPVRDDGALDRIAAELREERNCGFWNQDRGRLFCDDNGMQGDSGHREVCQCKADVRLVADRLASLSAPAGDVPGEAQTQEGERCE